MEVKEGVKHFVQDKRLLKITPKGNVHERKLINFHEQSEFTSFYNFERSDNY